MLTTKKITETLKDLENGKLIVLSEVFYHEQLYFEARDEILGKDDFLMFALRRNAKDHHIKTI